MMRNTILVVEDEERLSDSLCKHLKAANFNCVQALDGAQALSQFFKHSPDLIILDIMLPDTNGIDVCKKIRRISQVPIIMVTARVDESDRIEGFAVGADDYVCKPFSPKELIFRVQAVLRRVASGIVQSHNSTVVIEHGPIALYADQYRVTVDGIGVPLTMIEFQLLSMLISDPDQAFSRAELLTAAHGKYSENYDRTIDSHIKNLRKKINISKEMRFIKTVYGIGYRLEPTLGTISVGSSAYQYER